MTEPQGARRPPTAPTSTGNHSDHTPNLPPGDHPLEVAARAGIGPLSTLGQKTWHGQARPCVTCGQLVRRSAAQCDSCGQDLSDEMLARMRKHAGPWYVLEHLRPFPGVALDRVLLQVRRGLITPTSIVRGPATDYQWRFAVETPGLCRLFGRCWNCYHGVRESDAYCPACLSHLGFEKSAPTTATAAPKPAQPSQPPPRAPSSTPPTPAATARTRTPDDAGRLSELALAVKKVQESRPAPLEEPPTPGLSRNRWIAVLVVVVFFVALFWFTTLRERQTSIRRPPSPAPPAALDQG